MYITVESWQHGDTIPLNLYYRYGEQYDNPSDTLGIGVKTIILDPETRALRFGYDGEVRIVVYEETKRNIIDDFTFRPLPFRPESAPFFQQTKNIIEYVLNTTDNIETQWSDREDHYCLKLTINEEKQVEFFGRAYHVDNSYCLYPTSIYELWISKATYLPYKCRREMSHNISVRIWTDYELNRLDAENFNLYDYLDPEYEIRPYGQRGNSAPANEMEGTAALEWTLMDMDEHPFTYPTSTARCYYSSLQGLVVDRVKFRFLF